jgi:CelD/BcsL family acetyltransferase involved in cellulose biosynthesis
VGTTGTLLVEDERDLASHLAGWNALAAQCRRPYCQPQWMLAWWHHAAPPGAVLRVVLVLDGEELIGVAPYFAGRERTGRIDYRLLASGLSHPLDILAVAGREPDVATAVAAALARARPRPSLVTFEGLPAGTGWPAAVRSHWPGRLRPGTYWTRDMASPVLDLHPDGFEAWLAAKSSNFRQQMRRARRKLAAAGGAVELAAGDEAIARATAAFSELHHARWSHRGGSGLPRQGMAALLEEAALALGPDHVRLWVVGLEGRPIAVQVFAAAGGEVAYWNGGWDERHSSLIPAQLGILGAIEDAFGRRERRIDFGPGAQDYKLRFAGREEQAAAIDWSGLFPIGRRYPVTRVELSLRQLEWWLKRRARTLPPHQRERLRRLRSLAHGRLR